MDGCGWDGMGDGGGALAGEVNAFGGAMVLLGRVLPSVYCEGGLARRMLLVPVEGEGMGWIVIIIESL